MRNLHQLDRWRDRSPEVIAAYGSAGDAENGAFLISSPTDRQLMRVIASAGGGWEHVSVSRPTRLPNWLEMAHVKELFFEDTETVMQLHVPAADHVNCHPHCLHLWRPLGQMIPRPPTWMVGPTPRI